MLEFNESAYKEIKVLQDIYLKHQIQIDTSNSAFLAEHNDYPAVTLSLNGDQLSLFVNDEFSDFKLQKPLLSLCLVLCELNFEVLFKK